MSKILVVDDEPLIRDVVVDLLRDEGYEAVTVPLPWRCSGKRCRVST